MKTFEDWFMEDPTIPANQLPELPFGVVETKKLGHYLFQCRSCDDWVPMEWDLSEDCYESHYCGKSPRCCP